MSQKPIKVNNNSYGKTVTLNSSGLVTYNGNPVKMPNYLFIVDLVKNQHGLPSALVLGHIMSFCRKGNPFNASYGITAVKLRMSRETIRRTIRKLSHVKLINIASNGDITPNTESEYNRHILGKYIESYANCKPTDRAAIKYKYDLTLLPTLVNERESITARLVAYVDAVIVSKIANQHINHDYEDFKHSPQTYRQLAKECDISEPTAKAICDRLSKLGRFFKAVDCKTLILKAAATATKAIKESIAILGKFVKNKVLPAALQAIEQNQETEQDRHLKQYHAYITNPT
jgi:DNA-binding Lrp family transcriptional regulator